MVSRHNGEASAPHPALDSTDGPEQGRVTAAGKRRKCPSCGTRDIARIMYGLPLMDDVWRQKLDGGEWSIGGCMIMPNAPDRECNTCHRQFRQDGSDPYGAQGGNWG